MRKNYLIKYGLAVLFLICAIPLVAQKSGFAGKIVDQSNQPLSGATVHVKGTDQAAVTDLNGRFVFPGNNQSAITVVITFVGYDALERVISANESATIQLIPNQKALLGVVVVGYGTVRKTDLTGAVSNLSSKDLNPDSEYEPFTTIGGKSSRGKRHTNRK